MHVPVGNQCNGKALDFRWWRKFRLFSKKIINYLHKSAFLRQKYFVMNLNRNLRFFLKKFITYQIPDSNWISSRKHSQKSRKWTKNLKHERTLEICKNVFSLSQLLGFSAFGLDPQSNLNNLQSTNFIQIVPNWSRLCEIKFCKFNKKKI